jgi:imidazole glycerol phosphate synthase glutamine amidotransferase subunit
MIGLVDYGAGNLRNVQAALDRLGASYRLATAPGDLLHLGGVVLPGVGQFGAAARRLRETGLFEALRSYLRAGGPLLGICLGMQLLFEASDEEPGVEGLGILPGAARRLQTERLPHIGWAEVETAAAGEDSLFQGLPARFFAYFAHSYALPPATFGAAALTTCPPAFASAVRVGPVWGVQFHPEKSGADGQRILANFLAGLGTRAVAGREEAT